MTTTQHTDVIPPRSYILDASAIIAYLSGEPGNLLVESHMLHSAMSSVNWTEVIQYVISKNRDVTEVRNSLEQMGLVVASFAQEDAELAAELRTVTTSAGLSLADRACLALALKLNLPTLTADRQWTQVDVGVEVQLIR
ncbi:MAG: type II toxin-antitoxin system VapC family toxin [Dehalococcoidia bacterium]